MILLDYQPQQESCWDGRRLRGEWVRLLCTSLICFQGISKNRLEEVGGRCGSSTSARHCGEKSVHAERVVGSWEMDGGDRHRLTRMITVLSAYSNMRLISTDPNPETNLTTHQCQSRPLLSSVPPPCLLCNNPTPLLLTHYVKESKRYNKTVA